MNRRIWIKALAVAASTLALLAASGTTASAADPKSYTIVNLVDYVGPFADIAAPVFGGREAVVRWWNAEVGKGLGVELKVKTFDTRSDPAQAASLWPAISAEKPIAIFSFGASDALPLRDRVIEAKIPLYFSGSVPLALWVPDSWFFAPRPSYAHESGAFFDAIYKATKRTTPIKVAILGSEAVPVFVDMVKGLQAYAAMSGKITVEPVWDAPQPADLTTQMQRIVKAGVEYLVIQSNTAGVVAAQRALMTLGANIPLVLTGHNGLLPSGKALNDLKVMENNYEVHVIPLPVGDTPAKKFYDLLVAKYGFKSDWAPLAAQGITQGLMTVRSIEMAVKKFGPANLDGAKVREGLFSDSLKLGFGYMPDLKMERHTPFPVVGMTANIAQIKDGKYLLKYADVPLPNLKKW